MSQLSMVPNSARPSATAARTSASLSSSQRSFMPLKYVDSGSPVTPRNASCRARENGQSSVSSVRSAQLSRTRSEQRPRLPARDMWICVVVLEGRV